MRLVETIEVFIFIRLSVDGYRHYLGFIIYYLVTL